jgi:hypothetical protein
MYLEIVFPQNFFYNKTKYPLPSLPYFNVTKYCFNDKKKYFNFYLRSIRGHSQNIFFSLNVKVNKKKLGWHKEGKKGLKKNYFSFQQNSFSQNSQTKNNFLKFFFYFLN